MRFRGFEPSPLAMFVLNPSEPFIGARNVSGPASSPSQAGGGTISPELGRPQVLSAGEKRRSRRAPSLTFVVLRELIGARRRQADSRGRVPSQRTRQNVLGRPSARLPTGTPEGGARLSESNTTNVIDGALATPPLRFNDQDFRSGPIC